MIILHASASDGRLMLWGETSAQEPVKAAPRQSKSSAQPARSRFALEAYRLVDAVAAEVPGSRALASEAAVVGRLAPLE